MRVILLFICFSLLSLNAYSQSKLAGAGKATKVGGSAASKTATKKKPARTSTPVKKTPSQTSTIKQDPNEKYESSGYMEITGISFANTDKDDHIIDDFGANLYASEVKFLAPKVFYRGLASEEKEISIDVKIIKEDGTLKTGALSPSGYTYSYKYNVEPGAGKSIKLSGWGNNLGGTYTSGQYKFEIWYNGNVLYEKGVRLYSGTTPLATSKIIRINGISFSNQNNVGTIITDFGESLYEGEVQYITPKINYTGLYSTEQNVALYYKYFQPSGSMITGDSSPLCYSTKENVVVKPGTNSLKLTGWGSSSGKIYKEGQHKFEIWLDGEKIYETTFEVKKKGTLSGRATLDDFFPIYGFKLGKTTWDEAISLGYEVKIFGNGPDRVTEVPGGLDIWDHGGSGRFTSVYMTHFNTFPALWKELGMDWSLSYNKWLQFFKENGFRVQVKKEPKIKIYSSRNTISAEFEAISSDNTISFNLDFNYGNGSGEGYTTDSSNSLYSITIDAIE